MRFGPGGESTPLTDAIEKAVADGGVLVDPAFLSTSTNKKRSEQYASKNAANVSSSNRLSVTGRSTS